MIQLFIVLAGLYGASGVGLAAASAHGADGAALAPAAQMLLVHAPALLALGLYGRVAGGLGRLFTAAGLEIALGAALFAGAIVLRHFTGHSLFPMAAPVGGTLMILGWSLLVVAGALLGRRRLG